MSIAIGVIFGLEIDLGLESSGLGLGLEGVS